MGERIADHPARPVRHRDEGECVIEPGEDIGRRPRLGLEGREAILDALVVDLGDGGASPLAAGRALRLILDSSIFPEILNLRFSWRLT
jgi:hypothetical protein